MINATTAILTRNKACEAIGTLWPLTKDPACSEMKRLYLSWAVSALVEFIHEGYTADLQLALLWVKSARQEDSSYWD